MWGVHAQVEGLLSPRGQLFMVTVAENDPDEVLRCFERNGLAGGALCLAGKRQGALSKEKC